MGVNVCVCTAATHIGMCTLLQSNATYQDEFEVFFRFEKKYFCSSTSLSGIANSKTSSLRGFFFRLLLPSSSIFGFAKPSKFSIVGFSLVVVVVVETFSHFKR